MKIIHAEIVLLCKNTKRNEEEVKERFAVFRAPAEWFPRRKGQELAVLPPALSAPGRTPGLQGDPDSPVKGTQTHRAPRNQAPPNSVEGIRDVRVIVQKVYRG